MVFKDKVLFVDYEGVLSEKPVGSNFDKTVNLNDLLFDDVFRNCKPIKKMQEFLRECVPNNIFVIGVIDTNYEIESKHYWLNQYYHFIIKENIIFISSEHKKVDVINAFVKNKKLKKESIIFIDDKESHLKHAREQQYICLNVNEI